MANAKDMSVQGKLPAASYGEVSGLAGKRQLILSVRLGSDFFLRF